MNRRELLSSLKSKQRDYSGITEQGNCLVAKLKHLFPMLSDIDMSTLIERSTPRIRNRCIWDQGCMEDSIWKGENVMEAMSPSLLRLLLECMTALNCVIMFCPYYSLSKSLAR